MVNTNGCHLGVAVSGKNTVIVSAIDNLVKGAAGQAIQNLNLALGFEEAAGLPSAFDHAAKREPAPKGARA